MTATTPSTDTHPSETIPIRVLKTGTCKSLSGKSDITHQVGVQGQSDLMIRIEANSAAGYFNNEWVPYAEIQKVLAKYPKLTSFALRQVYVGKSINSPGFLLAVLVAEGLVQPAGGGERHYVAMDSAKFMAEVQALMDKPDTGEATPAAAIKKSKKA